MTQYLSFGVLRRNMLVEFGSAAEMTARTTRHKTVEPCFYNLQILMSGFRSQGQQNMPDFVAKKPKCGPESILCLEPCVGKIRMHDVRSPHLFGRVAKAKIPSALIAASLLLATHVRAQVAGYERSSAPIYGGIGVAPRPVNPYPPMQGTFADSHKTPDGKLCISVHPSARPQIVNPKIIDQIVTMNNICGQSIRVQVCIADSSNCIVVPLEGYQRVQKILAIATSNVFMFDYRELF
jgi:hypothetical protein